MSRTSEIYCDNKSTITIRFNAPGVDRKAEPLKRFFVYILEDLIEKLIDVQMRSKSMGTNNQFNRDNLPRMFVKEHE